MLYLCRNLKLSIQWLNNHQLHLSLSNDLSLDEVQLDLEVNDPVLKGGSRAYQNREAIIIAMRRLVSAALKANLIMDSPGALTNSNAGGVDIPMMSTTDEEFWLQHSVI
jgi:hypothetical protein